MGGKFINTVCTENTEKRRKLKVNRKFPRIIIKFHKISFRIINFQHFETLFRMMASKINLTDKSIFNLNSNASVMSFWFPQAVAERCYARTLFLKFTRKHLCSVPFKTAGLFIAVLVKGDSSAGVFQWALRIF